MAVSLTVYEIFSVKE